MIQSVSRRQWLGIELDDNLIENERNAPEWEFPTRSDSFDGSVLDH